MANNYEEQRAYRLAVDLIKKQMQRIAFDRSMFTDRPLGSWQLAVASPGSELLRNGYFVWVLA